MNKKGIIAVIPAKADSKRLPNKNTCVIDGKPLLFYTIKIAKESSLIDKIYVSTDSDEVASYAKAQGVSVVMRTSLLTGETPIVEVYRHAVNNISDSQINLIVGLQPDHPDRNVDLDTVIKYALEKKLDDLISVDSKGFKNGSIRIMSSVALRDGKISINCGSVMDNATNIHTGADLSLAKVRLSQKGLPLSIKIGDKTISNDSRTFVIAEGACNHMCDMNIAKRMIDEAVSAGADAIKFQTYKAEKLVAKEAAAYWNYGTTKSQYEYYKKLDKFGKPEYKVLFDYARQKNIIAFSSPFDSESAGLLNELDMPLFKIASCLVPNKNLIRQIAGFKKPVILSTGGSELSEIREAVETIYEEGNFNVILMACTLSYPTKNADAHLLRIRELLGHFPETIIGCSDHAEPDENMVIPSVAVSLGAKVIEKHFTLDRTMTGSGHSFSVDPVSLKKMIQNIRLTEEVMGQSALEVKAAEKASRQNARMSIVASRQIKKDEVLTEEILTSRRPGTGVLPKYIDDMIGKKAKRVILREEQVKWEDIY